MLAVYKPPSDLQEQFQQLNFKVAITAPPGSPSRKPTREKRNGFTRLVCPHTPSEAQDAYALLFDEPPTPQLLFFDTSALVPPPVVKVCNDAESHWVKLGGLIHPPLAHLLEQDQNYITFLATVQEMQEAQYDSLIGAVQHPGVVVLPNVLAEFTDGLDRGKDVLEKLGPKTGLARDMFRRRITLEETLLRTLTNNHQPFDIVDVVPPDLQSLDEIQAYVDSAADRYGIPASPADKLLVVGVLATALGSPGQTFATLTRDNDVIDLLRSIIKEQPHPQITFSRTGIPRSTLSRAELCCNFQTREPGYSPQPTQLEDIAQSV